MFSKRMTPFVLLGLVMMASGLALASGPAASVEGSFVANGVKTELSHVYVYAEKKGFYDEADPTWKLLFVEHPVEERELDDSIWDAAYIRLGITRTAEFGDEPELQIYSQDIRFSADQAGNVSGGSYPELELSEAGPDRFVGRVNHAEVQTIFDDSFQFDLSFSAPLSDPFGPIGDPLPAGGGEPGAAYLAWCDAVLAGDIERLGKLMPAEQAAMLDDEEFQDNIKEELEFMQLMTPTDLEIISGSSDGETAILHVTGMMDGEKVQGEITLTLIDGRWINTEAAW